MAILSKKLCYGLGLSCAPPHGASASSSGIGITITLDIHLIDEANGHDTGHRVKKQTTSTASSGPGPGKCTTSPSLTPEW